MDGETPLCEGGRPLFACGDGAALAATLAGMSEAAAPFTRIAGKAIRRIRRYLEISQEEMAYRCEVSAKHIGEIERGNKDPRLSTFAVMVERGLGMELEQFMRVCARYRETDRVPDLSGIDLPEPIGHINRPREWMPR